MPLFRQQGGGGSSTVSLLASSGVLAAPVASVDFSAIPATFKHLEIIIAAETSDAAVRDVAVIFNNDSAANYDAEFFSATAAVVAGAEGIALTSWLAFRIIPSAAAGGSPYVAWIPNYSGTVFHKIGFAGGGFANGVGAGLISTRVNIGRWRNTAAINRITFTPVAGNFVAGSIISLYGIS